MKRFTNLVVMALLAFSCTQQTNRPDRENEPKSTNDLSVSIAEALSNFPTESLAGDGMTITSKELHNVIDNGESGQWRNTSDDYERELVIKNKEALDRSIRFVFYRGNSVATVAVQQKSGKEVSIDTWKYDYGSKQWSPYLLHNYKLEDFFDDRVQLPDDFNLDAQPNLEYELGSSSITVSMNKWNFMREVEGKDNAPDPNLIRYQYVLKWTGDEFIEEKVTKPGYDDVLIFTSTLVESQPGGPDVHEFDCPHGVSVKTSSTLAKQGKYTYDASNVLKEPTAWAEGVEGEGIGEWIEFTITSDFHIGNSWQVVNGNNRNKEIWQANNRIKKMKVLVDDQVIGDVMLSNTFAYQEFNIAPGWLKDPPVFKRGTKIRFTIEEVYKGTTYNDTLISYFVPTGNCG